MTCICLAVGVGVASSRVNINSRGKFTAAFHYNGPCWLTVIMLIATNLCSRPTLAGSTRLKRPPCHLSIDHSRSFTDVVGNCGNTINRDGFNEAGLLIGDVTFVSYEHSFLTRQGPI